MEEFANIIFAGGMLVGTLLVIGIIHVSEKISEARRYRRARR